MKPKQGDAPRHFARLAAASSPPKVVAGEHGLNCSPPASREGGGDLDKRARELVGIARATKSAGH
jgi:hypothetical protein